MALKPVVTILSMALCAPTFSITFTSENSVELLTATLLHASCQQALTHEYISWLN